MRVLIIDTALDVCAAGVFEGTPGGEWRALARAVEPMARGHQEKIGPLVRDTVAASGGFDALDRIGVTVGPGSFTGLRVGLAFALGLGAALDRPVVGLSTLDGLAASVAADGRVAAAIDARRGQVYLRTYVDGSPDREAAPMELEAARALLAGTAGAWRLVGSGAGLIAPEGAEVVDRPAADLTAPDLAAPDLAAPDLAALARLAGEADPETHPARPMYLRAPDATPPTRLPGQARPRPAGV